MGMSRSDCARRMLATLDRIRQLESNRHKDWFALTTMVATATARLDSDGLWRDRYPDRTCIIKVIYLGLTTACCCWSNLSLPPQCINQAKLDQARKFPFPFPSRREEFRRWKHLVTKWPTISSSFTIFPWSSWMRNFANFAVDFLRR